jgi:hypothetical protein
MKMKGPGGKPRPWTPIPGLKRPWTIDTGGTRNAILPDFVFQGVFTGDPEPSLALHLPRKSGRHRYTGKIVTRHKGGGGWKRIFRIVDFKRSILNQVKSFLVVTKKKIQIWCIKLVFQVFVPVKKTYFLDESKVDEVFDCVNFY